MILDRLAAIIGTRRALQLQAITTLTKHLVEGSEHRLYRIGPLGYHIERNEISHSIPALFREDTR